MKILLSPQVNPGKKITYQFTGEIITATFEGVTDVFDFSLMPDGEANQIETALSINPIINAVKENGSLSIELLNFIPEDATENEKFPVWMEV